MPPAFYLPTYLPTYIRASNLLFLGHFVMHTFVTTSLLEESEAPLFWKHSGFISILPVTVRWWGDSGRGSRSHSHYKVVWSEIPHTPSSLSVKDLRADWTVHVSKQTMSGQAAFIHIIKDTLCWNCKNYLIYSQGQVGHPLSKKYRAPQYTEMIKAPEMHIFVILS